MALVSSPLSSTTPRISATHNCPQITQINPDGLKPPFSVWRGPGRPKTAGDCRAGTQLRIRALVTVSQPSSLRPKSASLATIFLHSIAGRSPPLPINTKERQNRRAFGTAAGEKRCDDERSHSEFASFSPATSDFESPVVLPERYGSALPTQPPLLCVFAPLRYWVGRGICAHLRYLRFLRANGSVFICVICGRFG